MRKDILKKTAKYGFLFFLIKGLLWLVVPLLIYLYNKLF
jgi:hypothetical protein